MLVASLFICICFSIKAFASAESSVGLPDREQFSVDPVFCILLMILVTLARLVDFHISRLSIFVQDKILPYGHKQFLFLVYEVTFGMIMLKLTVNSSLPQAHYMQIQFGCHGDAITHCNALKKSKLCTLPEYCFHMLSFSRSHYSHLFDSIKINIVFLIICLILCDSELP